MDPRPNHPYGIAEELLQANDVRPFRTSQRFHRPYIFATTQVPGILLSTVADTFLSTLQIWTYIKVIAKLLKIIYSILGNKAKWLFLDFKNLMLDRFPVSTAEHRLTNAEDGTLANNQWLTNVHIFFVLLSLEVALQILVSACSLIVPETGQLQRWYDFIALLKVNLANITSTLQFYFNIPSSLFYLSADFFINMLDSTLTSAN